MGVIFSSSPAQDEERRERELMERMGVLIPPSFGIGGVDATSPLPPSASTIVRQQYSPSLVAALNRHSVSYRILHHHMNPGLWVSASTPSNASVLAAFYGTEDNNEGMLSASQQFPQGKASIRAYTLESPLISADYSPVTGWNILGRVNGKGKAWVGCHLNPPEWLRMRDEMKRARQYYRNDPFLDDKQATKPTADASFEGFQLGTFVHLDTPTPNMSHVHVNSILGFASMQVSGCTVAMEATVPVEPLKDHPPRVDYYVSANLNPDGPPLVVSMQHCPSRSVASMSLSQVLTFDRVVLNAFETRCPRIRNTFAWAVQMEKTDDDGETNPQIMAGLAWQINRGVGCKVVAKPTGVTAAVLLKRWKQPRVLCSLLVGTEGLGRDVQLGIGLELETGPQQGHDYYNDSEDRRVDEDIPATKATLPERPLRDTTSASAFR